MKGSQQAELALHRLALRNWRILRLPVTALLTWITVEHLMGADWVFLDHANLALHEGGHVITRWAGDTLQALAGTLTQVLFPLLFTAYFITRHDRFAAAATTWWACQSLMSVARYMADARTQRLPLVGGDIHDWNFLLRDWAQLDHAVEIAGWVKLVGLLGMVLLLGIMAWLALFPRPSDLRVSFRA